MPPSPPPDPKSTTIPTPTPKGTKSSMFSSPSALPLPRSPGSYRNPIPITKTRPPSRAGRRIILSDDEEDLDSSADELSKPSPPTLKRPPSPTKKRTIIEISDDDSPRPTNEKPKAKMKRFRGLVAPVPKQGATPSGGLEGAVTRPLPNPWRETPEEAQKRLERLLSGFRTGAGSSILTATGKSDIRSGIGNMIGVRDGKTIAGTAVKDTSTGGTYASGTADQQPPTSRDNAAGGRTTQQRMTWDRMGMSRMPPKGAALLGMKADGSSSTPSQKTQSESLSRRFPWDGAAARLKRDATSTTPKGLNRQTTGPRLGHAKNVISIPDDTPTASLPSPPSTLKPLQTTSSKLFYNAVLAPPERRAAAVALDRLRTKNNGSPPHGTAKTSTLAIAAGIKKTLVSGEDGTPARQRTPQNDGAPPPDSRQDTITLAPVTHLKTSLRTPESIFAPSKSPQKNDSSLKIFLKDKALSTYAEVFKAPPERAAAAAALASIRGAPHPSSWIRSPTASSKALRAPQSSLYGPIAKSKTYGKTKAGRTTTNRNFTTSAADATLDKSDYPIKPTSTSIYIPSSSPLSTASDSSSTVLKAQKASPESSTPTTDDENVPVGEFIAKTGASLQRLHTAIRKVLVQGDEEAIAVLRRDLRHNWEVDEMSVFVEGFMRGCLWERIAEYQENEGKEK